jgi:LuxR family maltose regulon positive regulatory protein
MERLDRAVALVLARRSGEARRHVDDALADARRHDRGYLAARATSVLALVAAADGEYRRLAELAAAADAELTRGGWRATAGAGLPRLLGAYGALLDLHPERCLDLLAAAPADPADAVFGPLRSALRAAALTDLHRDFEAESELRLARSALAGRIPPRLAAPTVLLAHGVAVDLGRPDLAADLARRAGELLGSTGDLVLMATRQDVSGSGALRDVLVGAVVPVVPWAVGEAHARACAAALAAGRSPLARRELEAALAAAGTTGALRPLLAGGAAVTGLLARQIGSFGAGDAVAARVLAVCDRPDGPHRGSSPFTERERDVLELLSSPHSLQEIATVLGVAPSTVKTHVRAIYTKLGVRSRRAAVAAGRRGGAVAVGRR